MCIRDSTIVKADGQPCECGKYGCLQTIASARWLLKYARLLYQNTTDTILKSMADSTEELTIQHITTAYSMGCLLYTSTTNHWPVSFLWQVFL